VTDAQAFYQHVMDAAGRDAFEAARRVQGLADEVALLRMQVRDLLADGQPDPKVLQGGIRLLVQAVAAQHRLSGEQAEALGDAFATLIEQFAAVAAPAGVTGDEA